MHAAGRTRNKQGVVQEQVRRAGEARAGLSQRALRHGRQRHATLSVHRSDDAWARKSSMASSEKMVPMSQSSY
jgi:hypothetical protein